MKLREDSSNFTETFLCCASDGFRRTTSIYLTHGDFQVEKDYHLVISKKLSSNFNQTVVLWYHWCILIDP